MFQRFNLAAMVLVIAGMFLGCDNTSDSPSPPEIGVSDAPVEAAVSPEQAAQDTAQAMLGLAKAGEWGKLIDEHYGESHKFTSDADRDALAKRFSDGWGAKLIPVLEQASQATPEIEGDKAIFKVAGAPVYQLHQSDDGGWKFHL